MRKISFLSSAFVFLILFFLVASQICAEESSNLQNINEKRSASSATDNDSGNKNVVKQQNLLSSNENEDKSKDEDSTIEDEEESNTLDKEAADSVEHAKAISERNKKKLIKKGILKEEDSQKVIIPGEEDIAAKDEKTQEVKKVKKEKDNISKKTSNVICITSSEQLMELIKDEVPVLVYFYADWSAPCDLIDQTMIDISKDANGKYKIAKIDVDLNYGLYKQYNIKTLPTVILFVSGQEKEREEGRLLKYKYVNMLAQN